MSMKRDGWITKCIGDCFEYIKNGANIKQEKNASGYPITRIETLANGVFNRDRMGYANIFDVGKYCINILQDQDILMSHINSKAYIGRSVIYRKIDNEIIIHGMNLLRLIAKKDFLNPYYANYYFKTDSFKGDVAKIRKDAVNQSSMAISDLSKIKMPIPPLPEQSRIVEELDQLSNIIEKKRQQLSELDNLAQSIFYDTFGDPVTNERGWEVRDFSKCYKLSSGDGLSAKNIIEGDFPVYGGNGIVGYHSDYNMDGEYIIIGRVGALCGNVRNVIGKAFITDNAFVLTKNVENINVYLLYLLKIHNLRQYAREAMQPVISNASLKNIRIILPPLQFQQFFAQKIEAIEKEKELIKQSIKETEELFNSRMDYYFG